MLLIHHVSNISPRKKGLNKSSRMPEIFTCQSKRCYKCSAFKREEELKKQALLPQTHYADRDTIQVQNVPIFLSCYIVPQCNDLFRYSPRLCVEGVDSALQNWKTTQITSNLNFLLYWFHLPEHTHLFKCKTHGIGLL